MITLIKAYKLNVLQAPQKDFGLKQPLHDIELLNIAAIGHNIVHINNLKHITNANRHQMALDAQKKSVAIYITQNYLPNWTGRHSAKSLYKELLSKDGLDSLVKDKFRKRRLGSPTDVKMLLTNYNQLKNSTPDYLRYHQIRLTYNALPTEHRFRATRRNDTSPISLCPFCSNYNETIDHLYGGNISRNRNACTITDTIRTHFARYTNLFHIVNFTFSDHILISPQSPETVNKIIIYNHSLWMTRYWIKGHSTTPTVKAMISFTISKYKVKLNKF